MKHFFPYRVRRVLTGGAFILLSMCVTAISAAAQTSAVDAAYAPTVTRSGAIAALVRQPDGKILIGGDIRTVNGTARLNLARLNADGTTDAAFTPGSGPDSPVTTIALQSDGKILIAGTFRIFNGAPRRGLARLNADGTLDQAFNPGTIPNIGAVAVQTDGKILAAGTQSQAGGSPFVRLNADGTIDPAFTPPLFEGTPADIRAIIIQPNGKLLVGGQFTTVGGSAYGGVTRLNPDGTLDAGFIPGTGVSVGLVEAAALLSDGKIMIGGRFIRFGSVTRNGLARLNADGTLDTTFNPGSGVDGAITDLLIQPDGKIVIGGGFTQVNGTFRLNFARLNADGTLDTGFNPILGPELPVTSLALQPDGRILLGGTFSTFSGVSRAGIARAGTSGLIDIFFNPTTQTDGFVDAIAVQSDGKAVIGGFFSSVNGVTRNNLARLNTDGTLDTTFNPSGSVLGTVSTVVIQSDGKILVGGLFVSAAEATRNSLARLNADGSLDQNLNVDFTPGTFIVTFAVQLDGKVLVVGLIPINNLSATIFFRRLNVDGTSDTSFALTQPPGAVQAIATSSDGFYVGGLLQPPPNSTIPSVVAKYTLEGLRVPGFNPETLLRSQVNSIRVQSDGRIVIGGFFQQIGLTPRDGLARLNPSGENDPTFAPSIPVSLNTPRLDLQSDGKVLVGGTFTGITGSRGFVNRLNSDGSLDPTVSSSIGANGVISVVSAQKDGKMLVGGRFTSVGGVARRGIARLVSESTSCGFSLSPSSSTFPSTGGFGTVTVTTSGDCTWTSSGVPAWVSGIPTRGAETTTTSFTVRPNNGPARTATFTIAGQSFTVTQAGPPRASTPGQFRPSNGFVYLRNTNDTGIADTEFFYGTANDVPVAGDWDGNGTDSIGIYRDGTFFLRNSNTSGFADIQFPFGAPGDIPLVGDWDGDGIDTVGIVRGNTVFLRNSNTAGNADIQFNYGTATDIFITGDWNGDGIDTIGAFRPSNGFVYIRNANTTGIADSEFFYGQAGDRPVVGDWNADGIDTIGIVRGNQWFLRNSNTSGFADIQYFYGTDTDIPLSGNWNGLQ